MRLESSGSEETFRIGKKLGGMLKAGDVVCLIGDIGAGKTTLIKGIASALGINERDVTSASFTIIAEYETDPPFYHIDLYRLRGGDDVFGTGVYDYIECGGIAAIEWAERLDDLPEGAVIVRIDISGDSERTLRIDGIDEEDWDNMQTG